MSASEHEYDDELDIDYSEIERRSVLISQLFQGAGRADL